MRRGFAHLPPLGAFGNVWQHSWLLQCVYVTGISWIETRNAARHRTPHSKPPTAQCSNASSAETEKRCSNTTLLIADLWPLTRSGPNPDERFRSRESRHQNVGSYSLVKVLRGRKYTEQNGGTSPNGHGLEFSENVRVIKCQRVCPLSSFTSHI